MKTMENINGIRESPPSSNKFDKVVCPKCGGRKIEMYMRAVIFYNDPMTCLCGYHFKASEIKELWEN